MSHEPGEVWEQFAVALAEMARDLLAQDTVQGTLDRVVEHATVLINGCDDAGILTVRRGEVRPLAATSDVVRRADRIQQDLREGPCFDAVTDRQQIYTIEDLNRPHERWSHFAPELRRLGMGSVMGFLLFTEDDELGASTCTPADHAPSTRPLSGPAGSSPRTRPSPSPRPVHISSSVMPWRPVTRSARPWASSWSATR